MKTTIFPEVSGRNLNRKKYAFPEDFSANYSLVLMAFYRHQQEDIDTWLPFAAQLERKHSGFTYFEFPVIYRMGPIGRFMLNEGMRAGIPDTLARERTITLYLEKAQFLRSLGIESEEEIQLLLINPEGEVVWRETGVFSPDKAHSLHRFVEQTDLPERPAVRQ